MEFNIDHIIYVSFGFLKLNATIVNSWIVMVILVGISWLITRRLTSGTEISRWQALLETIVVIISDSIKEATRETPERYLSFIGTLFLFIVTANILVIIPGFYPPTASLSATAALALCVFIAVPVFGITKSGFRRYLRYYIQPTPLMLPFTLIGEISRTMALAIRLFGNIMSGSLIVAVLISITPLFFPVIMQAFGLLIGVIQAYVFAMLALVYIASATRTQTLHVAAPITSNDT